MQNAKANAVQGKKSPLAPFFIKILTGCFLFHVCLITVSHAATNTWDFNGATPPNPADGSGAWLTANDWWNGTANVSGNWTSTGPDDAIFGAGTPGTYLVSLGGGNIYASNIVFSTSGYTLTNGTLNLLGNSVPFTVNAGVTASLKNALTANTASTTFQVGSSGTLSLAGGATLPGNVVFAGGGTVDLNAGTYAGVNFVFWEQTAVTQEAATLNAARIMVGYGGNCTYTINSPGAQATSSGSGGDSFVGRGGSAGTWDLEQGTVTLTAVGGDNLRVGYDGSSRGTLMVEGGTFNLGNNTLFINHAATSSGGAGTVNLSGGTLTAGAVQFGAGGTFNSGATAALNVSGGTFYLGSGGIFIDALGTLAATITLSGGTIAAATNWVSSLPMTLANGNENITFQAADAGNNAQNITLSGAVSGIGGLTKTGGGVLALSGTNTYSGSTTINGGTLATTTASSGAGTYTNNGTTLNVQLASVGSSLNMSSLTLNAGSTLNLDLNSFGNPTAPVINVSGALTPTSTVTINLVGAALGAGQFPLIKYGSLGGAGFGAFALGTFTPPLGAGSSASLVNNTINQSIDLKVVGSSVPQLVWDGTVNGNWDIGGTANWKTNAYYTESNGVRPVVVFDDTASGPNTAIVLNTTVAPLSVVVSNSVLAYSISGSGGIGGTNGLLKQGAGNLTLGGNNTYTGRTTITGGKLALSGSGSISNSSAIEVNGSATFDVSGLTSTFALGSGQVLSNSASTGGINGNFNTGLGTVSLTYASGTPSLNVTNGTLTLSSGTVFKVNNTGVALAAGSYKIISKATGGNAGSVSGTVPAISVTGGGIVLNAASSILLSNSELYLVVSANVVDATFMTNKIMAGYQGWFRTPGDASGNTGWAHWFNGSPVNANLAFDTWPDMSELTPAEKFAVPGYYNPDGSQAYLYSAQIYSTVLRHFQWMQTAGIDGVWLSEFCSHMPGGANDSDYPNVTNIMNNVRHAATATGRTWAFMYDFSGLTSNNVVSVISNQWTRMVDSGITTDPRYMHQNGKPVLLLWSFYENRPQADPQYITPLLDFIQAPGKYQAFLVGGGDTGWRSSSAAFQAMILRLDGWQTWQVGRVSTDSTTGYKIPDTSLWAGDIALCNSSNVLYTPVFFSGTQIAGPPPTPPALATVPRRNGNFLWPQFVAASALHINNVFIAMFDECNEGTQIMKSCNTPPTNAPFLTFEGSTTDWYLRIVGLGASMLRSGTAVPAVLPISPFDTDFYYKIINHATGLVFNNQGSLSSGSPISQYTNNNNDANLQWQLLYDGNGYFTIKNRSSGKVIDTGGATTNGSPVIQTDNLGNDSSKWHFEWDGTGCCRIQSKVSGKSLSAGGATTNFAPVFQVTDASTDALRWQILQDATIPTNSSAPAVNFASTSGGGGGSAFNLSWPASSTSFLVESTTNLTSPVVWSPVTNTISTLGGSDSVTISPSVGNRFFRLRQP